MLYRSKKIYVDDSNVGGRGVFASEKINAGERLEECHFIKLPLGNYHKNLHDHFFSWPKSEEQFYALVLGYGSIFNHSDNNNADWETDPSNNKFIFFSIRDIEPGEEIFTNYLKEVDF